MFCVISEPKTRDTVQIFISSIPLITLLWFFRTYDTREAIEKSQENISMSLLTKGMDMISDNDNRKIRFGLLILAKLKQDNINNKHLIDSIDNSTRNITIDSTKTKIDLSRINLSKINLRRADLRGVDLCETNLYEANLLRAHLDGADLSRANLSRADLSRADLRGANLFGANLRGANLRTFSFRILYFLTNKSDFHNTQYNNKTRFPRNFKPPVDMIC